MYSDNKRTVYLNELLSTIGIGTWDWELATGKVIYSAAWAEILGYTLNELPQNVETWERMVLPEDLAGANEEIEKHLLGGKAMYEAEFRMVCKDGSIIWAQDKGQVSEYDENGKPIRFMGVLQNVSKLKEVEMRLLENQESLDLAVSIAELGTWDWDIVGNTIKYNDEYLDMVGYAQSDMNGSLEEWESMNHPEDLPHSMEMLEDYIAGKISSYECEIRMKHRDGGYTWTRDVGRIVARDAEGNPTRIIGGHLNIDSLKRSEMALSKAFEALEDNNLYLESEIENRTRELVEHDKMLWTVNQISRKLLAFHSEDKFESLVNDCLMLLGESVNRNRAYIWKDRVDNDGNRHCTQIYEWVRGAAPIQGEEQYQEIPYEGLPSFVEIMSEDRCLNSAVKDLHEREREILEPQGIKSILISPIFINGNRWGFVGIDNCDDEQLFTSVEENMLMMSGSILANTIEKMDTQVKMREMEEHTQIMLDATPLCCNLWTKDLCNTSCNQEAVRLFELSSQKEYLERFEELSPEIQPCGRLSSEMLEEYIKKAFEEGYCRFEWMHQKLDKTPIPTEITLERIKYKDEYMIAGYTRDLREFKDMIAKLQTKEDDLRSAMDEALLSSKAKSNFLANMSHEIRTPMNAIAGLAEIILRENPGEKISEYTKGIKNACSNLLNIINDILDISKIESGKLEIFNEEYELASLLNDVITISRMRLGGKPLMFITDIDSTLPAQLVGDEIRIKQILINLLGNAIKFTNEGHIALKVTSEIIGSKATIQFTITDSGVGVKQEDAKRLFAEFERVNTTKNRSIEGTGLGLAISKQLCEMMNGEITVNSIYGKGSEFTVTIPQECPNYQRIAQIKGEKTVLLYEPRQLYRNSIEKTLQNLECKCISCSNQSELYEGIQEKECGYILTAAMHLKKVQTLVKKKNLNAQIAVFASYGEIIEDHRIYTMLFPVSCLQLANLLNGSTDDRGYSNSKYSGVNFVAPTAKILVVDDNPVNLQVAEGLMAPYEFAIDTAINGRQAVEKIIDNTYDLVFMDHMMPEMDGIDATIAIRQLKGDYFQNLPIIALTANAIVGTREMFIKEGMNDFIAKPIEINKLSQVLLKWLPESKICKKENQEIEKIETGESTLKIDGVNTRHGIMTLGGSEEKYMQILAAYYHDGNEKCSSLINHIKTNNVQDFKTEVHALKSTSATIGAYELSAMAANLEIAAQNEDMAYISSAVDPFIRALSAVLEAIEIVLPVSPSNIHQNGETMEQGDLQYLKTQIEPLFTAAEFANIVSLESIISQLENFQWDETIIIELNNIRESLAVFDYDAVLESVEKIKANIQ